jgi:hypothetical protein
MFWGIVIVSANKRQTENVLKHVDRGDAPVCFSTLFVSDWDLQSQFVAGIPIPDTGELTSFFGSVKDGGFYGCFQHF